MNGGRLLVVVPEYQIAGLDALMATIDRPSMTTSSGTKRMIYRLKHRDIADAGVSEIINTYGTNTVTVAADTEINAVFIEDAPSGLDNIVEHWPLFDFPTKSLEIQVTVYEIDVSDDGQLGLDFISWKNGPGRNLAAIGAFYQKEKVTTFNGNQDTLIYNSGQGTFGLPGAEIYEWNAVFAPAGTPEPVVEKLAAALQKALDAPDVKARIAQLGGEMQRASPEAAQQFIREQTALWARVVKERKITVE